MRAHNICFTTFLLETILMRVITGFFVGDSSNEGSQHVFCWRRF